MDCWRKSTRDGDNRRRQNSADRVASSHRFQPASLLS
jgi:hypothetical protein